MLTETKALFDIKHTRARPCARALMADELTGLSAAPLISAVFCSINILSARLQSEITALINTRYCNW